MWKNNGNGVFEEVAGPQGIDGGDAATTGVLYFDIDDDRDLDLYLINHKSANRLFLNDRVGQYTEATERFPGLADEGPGTGALWADMDRNGKADLLLLRGSEPPRLFLQLDGSSYVEDEAFATMAEALGGAVGGVAGDLDLDGDSDLVLFSAGSKGKFGHRLLMNRGNGRFTDPAGLGEEQTAPRARGALAVDFDNDGSLELLVGRVGAPPEIWRAPAPKDRHWLQVIPAMNKDAEALRLHPDAEGLFVEVKSGQRLQVGRIMGSSGYLSSGPRRVHFGLGADAKVDYVRVAWADAVIQSEVEVAADQAWRFAKVKRKPSSCPILFSWDGERFAYITDFLGVGGMGFFSSPGDYPDPDPTEDVLIPPGKLVPRDGRYLVRIAEPLEEATYLDQAHLIAYDHPSDHELYP
ncbi:MAG: CRTAC1 family protein, partial [Verrucomicrobiota bacterium]